MELRIKIPKTAVISEKCTLIEWNVEVGEKVNLGQPLYLIETEKTAIEIDTEVRDIIGAAFDRAKSLLQKHIEILHKMAETLLEKESLDGEDIDGILKQYNIEIEPEPARA